MLDQLYRYKPREMSLSAFARELLESGIRRRRMINAADDYCRFLEAHEEEKKWLSDWEAGDLARPPGKRRKRKSH